MFAARTPAPGPDTAFLLTVAYDDHAPQPKALVDDLLWRDPWAAHAGGQVFTLPADLAHSYATALRSIATTRLDAVPWPVLSSVGTQHGGWSQRPPVPPTPTQVAALVETAWGATH